MKRFSGALVLLILSVFSAAAQITITAPAVKPTIDPTTQQTTLTNQTDAAKPITIAEAVDLALKQASLFRASQIGEQIAAQDVRQAKAALYPRVAANPTLIYTSPSLTNTATVGVTNGNISAINSRPPSFLGANAISEYQGLPIRVRSSSKRISPTRLPPICRWATA